MPRFDGTGPRGQGPRTGRGFGPCGSGMFAGGFGPCSLGWGMRGRFASKKNELMALEEEKTFLEEELSAINEEIEALKE